MTTPGNWGCPEGGNKRGESERGDDDGPGIGIAILIDGAETSDG